jgi:hypothetical protein
VLQRDNPTAGDPASPAFSTRKRVSRFGLCAVVAAAMMAARIALDAQPPTMLVVTRFRRR